MNKVPKLISGLTSPYLIIPVFGLITIYHYADSVRSFIYWSAILIGLAVLLPLGYVVVSIKRNKITDLHVYMREQRMVPF